MQTLLLLLKSQEYYKTSTSETQNNLVPQLLFAVHYSICYININP